MKSGAKRLITVLIAVNIVAVTALLVTVILDQVNTSPAGHPAQQDRGNRGR